MVRENRNIFRKNRKKTRQPLQQTARTGKSLDRAVQPATRKRKTPAFDAKLNARPACGVMLALRPDGDQSGLATWQQQIARPRGRINIPSRVRKAFRYPRVVWQMRLRAELGSRDARQRNARRAQRCQGRVLRSAARSDGAPEPPQELSAWPRQPVQPAEV